MTNLSRIMAENEELLQAYDERPSDRKELTDRLSKNLSEIQHLLEDCTNRRMSLLEEYQQLQKTIAEIKQNPECGKAVPKGESEKFKHRINDLDKDIQQLNEAIYSIQMALSGKRVFDKANCFQNIRNLMAEKNIKIGQLESAAGVRVGYMSRLEKPDNTSEPGIMFIATAAKMLGVTLDELIYSKAGELSEDEKYIRDFLRDLIEDTGRHTLHWQKEQDHILNTVHSIYDYVPSHPLLCADESQLDSNGVPHLWRYKSYFYTESDVWVRSAYSTKLPESDNMIYIVSCYTESDDSYIPDKEFTEIYFVNENRPSPICNTLQSSPAIVATVNTLIKTAISDASHFRIAPKTKDLIDAYRKNRDI